MTDNSDELDKTLAEYVRLSREHDLDGLMAMIAKDAVYLFSNETCHIGREAIRNAISHNFAAIEAESYEIENLQWLEQSEDSAVGVYEYTWAGSIQGVPATGSGRGTVGLRREDGEWLVFHEHLSRGSLHQT